MTTLPPVRALQAFEAFGRLGSVTQAARELGVSVGAVSQQLRKAEEAAGARLVERRGRNIELTALGRRYHAGLREGFDHIRAAHEALERARSGDVLTISCLPSLAGKWLGAPLFDWQARHPGAALRLIGEDGEPTLGDGQADFRITYGAAATRFAQYRQLFTDWVVPACAPSFLAKHPVRRPADILDTPLLGIVWARDQGAPPSWDDWAQSIGALHRPQSGEVAFSLSIAAIDAAINGRGFVLAQLSMAADDIAAGRLVVPFDAGIKLAEPYFLAWDPAVLDKPLGPELRAWITANAKRQETAFAARGWLRPMA